MTTRTLIYLFILMIFVLLSVIVLCNRPKHSANKSLCIAPARIKQRDSIPRKGQIEFNGNNTFKWEKKDTLYVYFFDGIETLQNEVLNIARIWSNYSRIYFEKTDYKAISNIRVSFLKGGGYASLIGNCSEDSIYYNKPTMTLDRLDTLFNSDFQEFRRVTLHEFGHALGLEHELQNPTAAIPWDTAAVFKYYLDHYGWDEDSVRHNIFNTIPNTTYSEFDNESIMIYAVLDTMTIGGKSGFGWPNNLSIIDKKYIREWYSH